MTARVFHGTPEESAVKWKKTLLSAKFSGVHCQKNPGGALFGVGWESGAPMGLTPRKRRAGSPGGACGGVRRQTRAAPASLEVSEGAPDQTPARHAGKGCAPSRRG